MTHGLSLAYAGSAHPAPPGQAWPVGDPPALPRLLPARGAVPVTLTAHLRRHGSPPYRGGRGRLIPEVAAAGLTGRGGAAFAVHRKLAAVAGSAPRPVVIGNGAEGEPASNKDKSLLWISPHLVFDGLQLAAEAVGAATVGLYVHRHPRLLSRLAQALAEREAAGTDLAAVELIEAPPRFLAGEESALASVVLGGPALPRLKPPRLSERGVAGRATLVQNVETLAHLALIARYGAAWFRSAGTADEAGTMLVTLHQASGRVDVVETALGTPLSSLLALGPDAGGPAPVNPAPASPAAPGPTPVSPTPVSAVLVGGYHGAWLTAAEAARLRLANADLRPAGAAVGAGVVAALPAARCGLAETARVVRYLALESAGQCGPCFNGLPRIAAALAELAGPRPRPAVRADLERWCGLVTGRGACHHPDGTVRLIRSALRVFGGEAERHSRGECSGGSGRPFLPVPAEAALDDADWR